MEFTSSRQDIKSRSEINVAVARLKDVISVCCEEGKRGSAGGGVMGVCDREGEG